MFEVSDMFWDVTSICRPDFFFIARGWWIVGTFCMKGHKKKLFKQRKKWPNFYDIFLWSQQSKKTRDLSDESSTNLLIGKAVIAQTEVSSLTDLIKETLNEFNLPSYDDLENFRLETSVVDETEGSEKENLDYDSIDSDDYPFWWL